MSVLKLLKWLVKVTDQMQTTQRLFKFIFNRCVRILSIQNVFVHHRKLLQLCKNKQKSCLQQCISLLYSLYSNGSVNFSIIDILS